MLRKKSAGVRTSGSDREALSERRRKMQKARRSYGEE